MKLYFVKLSYGNIRTAMVYRFEPSLKFFGRPTKKVKHRRETFSRQETEIN